MGRPPKNPDAEATTDRLLGAAEVAFGAQGLQRTRLGDIALEAGIQRSSLLYHFPSKEALHAAVVVRAFDELRAAVAQALVGGPAAPDAALERIVRRLIAFAEGRPALVSVVLRELVDPSGAGEVQRQFDALVRVLERTLRTLTGADAYPADFPLRDGILHILSGYLLRHAMRAGRAAEGHPDPLWGPSESVLTLARRLLLPPSPLAAEGSSPAQTPAATAHAGLAPSRGSKEDGAL